MSDHDGNEFRMYTIFAFTCIVAHVLFSILFGIYLERGMGCTKPGEYGMCRPADEQGDDLWNICLEKNKDECNGTCTWNSAADHVLYNCDNQQKVRRIIGLVSLCVTSILSMVFVYKGYSMREIDGPTKRVQALVAYVIWFVVFVAVSVMYVLESLLDLIRDAKGESVIDPTIMDSALRVVMLMHCLGILVTYWVWRFISYSATSFTTFRPTGHQRNNANAYDIAQLWRNRGLIRDWIFDPPFTIVERLKKELRDRTRKSRKVLRRLIILLTAVGVLFSLALSIYYKATQRGWGFVFLSASTVLLLVALVALVGAMAVVPERFAELLRTMVHLSTI